MKKTLITVIISCLSIIVFAQDKEIKIVFNKKGIIKKVSFPLNSVKENQKEIPLTAQHFFKHYIKINSFDDFVKEKHNQRNKGFVHEHYDQYYKGVKVDDGGYNLHFEKGRLYLAHGNFVKIEGLDISPSLIKEEAMHIFAKYKKIPDDIVKGSKIELLIKEISNSDRNNTVFYPTLVYKIYLYADHLNNNEIGIIDANSGIVLATEPSSIGFSATGTFETRYNGTKQAATQFYNNTFNLCDSSRGTIIHTKNLNGSSYISQAEEFTDINNIWTAAEYSVDKNDMGLDIHWGLQQIYDHFVDEYGIYSYDNDSAEIRAYFNYFFCISVITNNSI